VWRSFGGPVQHARSALPGSHEQPGTLKSSSSWQIFASGVTVNVIVVLGGVLAVEELPPVDV